MVDFAAMRIADLYGGREPVISFEFFPPKTDKGFASLFRTIEELKHINPDFVSVTMGAGGSTRGKTIDIVMRIQRELGVTAMCHLPCISFERAEIASILDTLERGGIENVLALGGDAPADQPDYQPPDDAFTYANELVEFIHSGPWSFSIGGGCYPEVHPRAINSEEDLANLVRKVAAGTDFLVTQLFLGNDDYFSFVDRARAAGIEVPIIPGIMPIASAANIKRMAKLANAKIPAELETKLNQAGDDDAAVAQIGVEWATAQCRDLLDRGAQGLHFYTLNRSPATREIHAALFGAPDGA
ncbi:MAG: methylenetetrahydrofolate reductase [NAD(P)H] [Myxococcota bacterium]|nr:methylenetetrahydrofolate reductase [NAD(P)H] [Myxococcota bacterium]